MATILNPSEGLVNLRVSWETYERLLAEHEQNNGVRFSYNRGELEILVPSVEHETLTSDIEALVELIAGEMDMDFVRTRCATFRREDMEKGFEADSSFYFINAARVRGKKRLDLATDPPPELVIEIDVTNSAMDKFVIYAAIGVQEVWRYSRGNLSIFILEDNRYVERPESATLPKAAASSLTEFIRSSAGLARPVWIMRVREWARSLSR